LARIVNDRRGFRLEKSCGYKVPGALHERAKLWYEAREREHILDRPRLVEPLFGHSSEVHYAEDVPVYPLLGSPG